MIPEVLRVRTVRVDDPGSLIEWLEPLHPTAFVRNGDGIVGIGERTQFAVTSSDRVAELAAWWRSLSSAALVDDEVGLPGSGLVAFGSFAFADSSGEPSVLVVPRVIVGRRDGVAWLTTIDDGIPVSPTPLGEVASVSLEPGVMTPEAYLAAVSAAITDARVSKVVLARDLVGAIPATADRRAVLARLAETYPDTYAFAARGLIGASPETLVRVTDGVVSARVLAGTSARGADATADAAAEAAILSSTKDRGEHAFAVTSVLSALEPHAASVTPDPEPYALRLPNLFHLASDITGTLSDGSTALDLVAALHPTAAVAGTPTPAALDVIAELEPFDRGRYAGPVGWVDASGDGEWAIALRCAHIDDDGAVTAWAGAGIVADSVPERELAETELKFRPIRDALGG